MRRGIGIGCMALGICCLIAAVGLMVYNSLEEEHAQDSSMHILQAVQKVLPEGAQKENGSSQSPSEKNKSENSEGVPDDLPQQMVTAQVDGYECIGVLSIPVLELELPVLTKWSYAKLKIAPCHYFGSYYETDFVIAAHNYDAHFGRLTELQPKDLILFTDISGTVHGYEAVLLETLPADATEEMITSGFDLSLYTCTPGGANRVTLRCRAVGNQGGEGSASLE